MLRVLQNSVLKGPRGHRGLRVIGSGFSCMPYKTEVSRDPMATFDVGLFHVRQINY